MDELGQLFCGGVIAVLVAVVLLAVWAARLARLRRELLGIGRPVAIPCPRCGAPLPANNRLCMTCGWSREMAVTMPLVRPTTTQQLLNRPNPSRIEGDLHAMARQLERWRDQGKIEPAEYERLSDLVGQEIAAPHSAATSPTGPSSILHPPSSALPPPLPVLPVAQPAPKAEPAPAPSSTFHPPSSPREPRRPLAQVLASFMEEKHMQWGELVGGLLIVGCSMALVISFWSQIAQHTLLKFSLFTLVTAALFGAGLYSRYRWKLPTTSRGVLLIATLLVPLNFLAFAALARDTDSPVLAAGAETVAAAVLAALVFAGGRVILPAAPMLLVVGVVGAAACQSLIRRWVDPSAGWEVVLAMGAAPAAIYAASSGWFIRRLRRAPDLGVTAANGLFILLGSAGFAVVLALGLLLFRAGRIEALQWLSPVFCLAGAAPLAGGLLLWRRMSGAETAAARTAGTAVAALGAMVLLGAVAAAWPDPALLLPVAVADFLILSALSVAYAIPAGHLLAVPCLMLAYLLGVHLTWPGHLSWTATSTEVAAAIFSASSGAALTALFAVLAGATAIWVRLGRGQDAVFYGLAAGATAAVSIGLALLFGFGRTDDAGATWVLGFYAIAAIAAAARAGLPAAGWVASALLLAALGQGMLFRYAGVLRLNAPLQTVLLTHASLAALIALATRAKLRMALGRAMSWSAIATSLLACAALVNTLAVPMLDGAALRLVWLASVWLVLAAVEDSPLLFAAFQLALAGACVVGATAWASWQDWFGRSDQPLLHPWTIQAQAIAVAAMGLLFSAGRAALRPIGNLADRRPRGWRALVPNWPVDRLLTAGAALLLAGMAVYGLWPSVAAELSSAPGAPMSPADTAYPLAALGWGSWLLLAILTAAMALDLWVYGGAAPLLVGMLVLWAACPLLAGRWMAEHAGASAFRWWAAGYLIAGSSIMWLRRTPQSQRSSLRTQHSLLLILAAVPILLLTIYPAAAALVGSPVAGPAAGSFFEHVGRRISYSLPLLAVMGVFIGHAVRERSARYAFAAGAILNLTVTLGFLLGLTSPMAAEQWVRLIQLNAIAWSAFAMAWLAVLTRMRSAVGAASADRERWSAEAAPTLLRVQVGLGVVAALALIAQAEIRLFVDPTDIAGTAAVGSVWGWLAIALALAAMIWRAALFGRPLGRRLAGTFCAAMLLVGSLTAFAMTALGHGHLSFHLLLSMHAVAGWLVMLVGWTVERSRPTVELAPGGADAQVAQPVGLLSRLLGKQDLMPVFVGWATAIALIVAVFCVRDGGREAGESLWSIGGLVVMGGLMAALGTWTGHRWRFYVASLMLNLAATIFWIAYHARWMTGTFDLLLLNILALALPAILWLVIDLRILRRTVVFEGVGKLPPLHRVAAGMAGWAAAAVVAVGLLGSAAGIHAGGNALLAWAGPLAAAALAFACLWDNRIARAPAGLYAMGLVLVGLVLNRLELSPRMLAWTTAVLLAFYAVLAAFLWNQRAALAAWGSWLGMPPRPPSAGRWMEKGNAALAIITLLLGGGLVLTLKQPAMLAIAGGVEVGALTLRMLAAAAIVAHGVAMGLLAADSPRQARLQAWALWLGVAGAVAWGWAMLPAPQGMLDRAVVLLVMAAAMTGVYSVVLVRVLRPGSRWLASVRAMAPRLVAACAGALLVILAAEINYYTAEQAVPMAGLAIAAVALALAGMTVLAIVVAISPRRDPLSLSERGRTVYVYAAEILLVLLFVHIRLTRPEWFSGFFERIWPLVVMTIAFGGVGLGEILRRQNQRVLAEPLERTGAFLPLLPVIGFWMLHPATNYSALLLLVGLLYGALAILRRSFAFGVLSALAANGALWYLLYNTGNLGLHQHPQLWLIPPALAVLAAAQLNRARLAPAQLATARYVGLSMIYISSTADIFLQGVAESPWLPLVLMVLSAGGVMAGMLLRVRAFLFLGTAFLSLAVLTMIAHASSSLGWTWLWPAAGIVLGVLIVAIFALFEKKRQEVLGVIEGLKQWER